MKEQVRTQEAETDQARTTAAAAEVAEVAKVDGVAKVADGNDGAGAANVAHVADNANNREPGVSRLGRQLAFIIEVDKLKSIMRRSKLADGSRHENDAEHTWHLMMMAIILEEHANSPGLDMLRVIKMLMIHDIVEIDAGDTFAYDAKGHEDKSEREQAAADRIYGLLPEEQRDELIALWQEFEAKETPEARYASALDRIQPMLLNMCNKGESWRANGVTSTQVLSYNSHIANGSAELWAYAQQMIEEAVEKGYLSK